MSKSSQRNGFYDFPESLNDRSNQVTAQKKQRNGQGRNAKKDYCRYDVDIPPEKWQVQTNRNRLYLWTHDENRKKNTKLFTELLRQPGIRLDKDRSFLFLDYEHRARWLKYKDPNADISQKAIEAPFKDYVFPDVTFSQHEAEDGFVEFLRVNYNITFKNPPRVGDKEPARGDYGNQKGHVSAKIEWDDSILGYDCQYHIFSADHLSGHFNDYNHFGISNRVRDYRTAQNLGRRSQADIERVGLPDKSHDIIEEVSRNATIGSFMTEEEKLKLAQQREALDRENKLQQERGGRNEAMNVDTARAFFHALPDINQVEKTHPAWKYFNDKHVLPIIGELSDLKANNGVNLPLIPKGKNEPLDYYYGSGVILPMYDIDGAIRSFQPYYYSFDKEKQEFVRQRKYATGMSKTGLMYPFPSEDMGVPGVPIILTEGFSTGASIYTALQNTTEKETGQKIDIPVVVAWDSGNLINIARICRERFPYSPIIIGADNDAGTASEFINGVSGPKKENGGIKSAMAVKDELVENVTVMIPPLDNFPPDTSVDFNDIHCKLGLDNLRQELSKHLSAYSLVISPVPEHLNQRETENVSYRFSYNNINISSFYPPKNNEALREYDAMIAQRRADESSSESGRNSAVEHLAQVSHRAQNDTQTTQNESQFTLREDSANSDNSRNQINQDGKEFNINEARNIVGNSKPIREAIEEGVNISKPKGFLLREEMRFYSGGVVNSIPEGSNDVVQKELKGGILLPLRGLDSKVNNFLVLSKREDNQFSFHHMPELPLKSSFFPVSSNKSNDLNMPLFLSESYSDAIQMKKSLQNDGYQPAILVCFTKDNMKSLANDFSELLPDKKIVLAPSKSISEQERDILNGLASQSNGNIVTLSLRDVDMSRTGSGNIIYNQANENGTEILEQNNATKNKSTNTPRLS